MLKVNTIIYKRFFKGSVLTLSQMRNATWFAHELTYGSDESYGPIIHSYEVKKKPHLLNLDKASVLKKIGKTFIDVGLTDEDAFNPDYIYGGGAGNRKFQDNLRKYFPEYDGTFIHTPEDEDWEGAQEIVLWRDFTKFLKKV